MTNSRAVIFYWTDPSILLFIYDVQSNETYLLLTERCNISFTSHEKNQAGPPVMYPTSYEDYVITISFNDVRIAFIPSMTLC